VISIFKRNDIGPFIALCIISVILHWRGIVHPPAISSIEYFHRGFLFEYKWLLAFYGHWASLCMIFACLLQFIFAIYFNYVLNRERLFARKTYLPALSFILLSSWMSSFSILSMPVVANFLLFIAFAKSLSLYHLPNARKSCFEIGLLVSLASVFYFPAVGFIILFLLLIILLRPFQLQEFIAYLLGILLVYYLAAGLLFVFGNLSSTTHHLFFHFSLPLKIASPKITIISSIVSILLFMYGAFLINNTGEQNSMAVRKKWNAVFFYCVFGLIAGIFSQIFPSYTWILTITPFSILLSQAFQHRTEKYNNFTLYFLMAVLLFTQWVLV
jgi:hypothetical protein